ncbi:MAG: TraR/DksA C4-type zinc finger protein [Planctomycetes bacterium]|nr:TraR/DksA C4-type zinc finger protein [Planctomycetota bacterium]
MATPKKNAPKKAAPTKAAKPKPAAKAPAKAKLAPKAKPEGKPKSPTVVPKKPERVIAKKSEPVDSKKAEPVITKKTDHAPRPVAKPKPVESPKPEIPPEPQKPQVDEEWQRNMRVMLAGQRQRLVSVVAATQAQMAEKSGDLPDISDRASEGFEDELAVGLMAIEAAQLEDINEAIERIDQGTYGLCIDCLKAIPKKRLEVLPFAKRCLACEGQSERRTRDIEAEEEEEEID